jgi:hypothetical protein
MIERIIAAARKGERNVKRLRDVGLTGLRKPNNDADEGEFDGRDGLSRSGLNARNAVLPKR